MSKALTVRDPFQEWKGQNNDDIVLEKGVQSLANPDTDILLAVRFEIQRNPALQSLFMEYKGAEESNAVETLAQQAAAILGTILKEDEQRILQATQYLADEYFQMGDKLLLIDRRTGRVAMQITEADLWQPPPVAREGSKKLVKREKEVRPELMGFLMRWTHEREREITTLQTLAKRGGSERSLLPSSLQGRATLVAELKSDLPTLLDGVKGIRGRILSFFPRVETPTNKVFAGFSSVARVELFQGDPLAANLKYDVLNSKKAEIGRQWTDSILRTISSLVHTEGPVIEKDFTDDAVFNTYSYMLVSHEVVPHFDSGGGVQILGAEAVYIDDIDPLWVPCKSVGTIVIRGCEVMHRHLHDKWEIAAKVEYDLGLDLEQLKAFRFTNVPQKVHMGEIVG